MRRVPRKNAQAASAVAAAVVAASAAAAVVAAASAAAAVAAVVAIAIAAASVVTKRLRIPSDFQGTMLLRSSSLFYFLVADDLVADRGESQAPTPGSLPLARFALGHFVSKLR